MNRSYHPAYHDDPMTRKSALVMEYVLLWIALPAGLAASRSVWEWPVIVVLWIITTGCLVCLLRDRSFDRTELWNAKAVPRHIKPVLIRYAILGPLLFLVAWRFLPDWFLGFPRAKPLLWLAVMVGYPIISVYAQGIVWRSFMLHRYREVGPTWVNIALATVAFSWLHVVFLNPIAPALTLVGGLLFATTHVKSRSLLVSSIEHALYGCTMITAGFGPYFFHGSQKFIQRLLEGG